MPPADTQTEMLFYDGHCALCHGLVKFVLRHDRAGTAFRFAPLQGDTFRARLGEPTRIALPDSIVLLTAHGQVLLRSDAVVHILARLGGGWKFLAGPLRVVPQFVRDAAYDFVARVRFRVFGTRRDLCPVVPPELRSRFDP